MMIDPVYPGGYSPDSSLRTGYQEKPDGEFQKLLREAQTEDDDKKLKEACREMEAVFLHLMLKQMRKTVPESGLFQESTAMKTYQDMLDDEYGKLMSQTRGGLGLGELLYESLKRDIQTKEE